MNRKMNDQHLQKTTTFKLSVEKLVNELTQFKPSIKARSLQHKYIILKKEMQTLWTLMTNIDEPHADNEMKEILKKIVVTACKAIIDLEKQEAKRKGKKKYNIT